MSKQKEYKIIIDGIKESIEGIATLQESLDKLGAKVAESGGHFNAASKSMDELAKSEQKINEYNKEYQTALQSNKMVLQDNAKEIKNKLDLEKAELIVQEDLRNTYAQKQQLLTAMGKVIKNTAGDTSELQQKYAELNQELKDFDASLGNHQRNVGDYAQATKNLKQELREYQQEMANMLANGIDKVDPKFVELAKKAGQLKDAISDAGEEINRFASDTKRLDDVINIAQSATAAFGLYKGAMSALGIESEATEKAIQKLAGAMTVIQSLKQLSETLKTGSITAKLFNSSLGLLTKGMQGASIGAKALRIALASIGIGLIISVVSALIEKWDDLVEWFQKTFPILGKLGSFFKGIVSVFVEFGKAIVKWVVTPIETVIGVISDLIHLDFSGAFSRVADGVKGIFTSAEEAAKQAQREMEERIDGYVDAAKRTAAALTNALNEEEHKQTEHQLNMLKARQGNEARYSEEGIKLQKKSFAERKKLAKDNADELRKIEIDEANFYRECEEYKTQQAQKGANERASAARQAAQAAKQAAEEEARRQEELREYRIKADEKLYKSTAEYLIAQKNLEIEIAKAELERYKNGPLEEYVKAMGKLNEKLAEREQLQRQLNLYDFFEDFRNNIDDSIESLDDFMSAINKIVKKSQEYGKEVSPSLFAEFAKENEIFKNLTEDQYKYLYGVYIDYVKDGLKNKEQLEKETNEKVAQQTVQIYKKTIDNLKSKIQELGSDQDARQGASVYDRLFSPKKAKKAEEEYKKYWQNILDETKKQFPILEATWNNYLESVKSIYTEDSKEYRDAQEQKKKALQEFLDFQKKAQTGSEGKRVPTSKGRISNASPINKNESKTDARGNTNWDSLWDGEQEVFENLEELADVFFENVFDPIAEAFSALLEFQIEEAQEALDKATEMHDKSVEQVAASNQRLAEIKNEMANASGNQLEMLKQQQADEMLLLAQREAEEKRLAREKEKRERELERKQKQQKKLELKMSLAEGITNTAVSVTKALTWGWPLGAIFAAIIGAMGAAQTAIIAKQLSKLADGGILGGRYHSDGGNPIPSMGVEVERGEAVINRKSTAKYLPLLDAINADGNGGKHTLLKTSSNIKRYAVGGVIDTNRMVNNIERNSTTQVIKESVGMIDMHPVVSVVDINRGQKNLATVRQMAGTSR